MDSAVPVSRNAFLLGPTYRKLLLVGAALGFAATTLLLLRSGFVEAAGSLRRVAHPAVIGLLVSATIGNLALRFVRWQYLLRRAGLRYPTRESLLVYLASLGLGFVPLFVGEIAFKTAVLGRGNPSAARRASTVAIYERVCDVASLSALAALYPLFSPPRSVAWALFALPAALFAWPRGRLAALHTARAAVAFVARLLRSPVARDEEVLVPELGASRHALVGFALGVAAWGLICAATAAVASLVLDSTRVWVVGPLFAQSTLLGGASLSPGGMGVTGIALNRDLVRLGAEAGAAFAIVLAVRASTFWLALVLGQIALLQAMRSVYVSEDHFDAMSAEYDAQIPPHVRELFVDRKTRQMLDRMGPAAGQRGLDIGCGLGWYMSSLRSHGARVVGMDLSAAQVRAAHAGGATVLRGSAVALPFESGTFDFAYSVNVVHHLPSREHQEQALIEAARILRPGGLLFIHEINVTNPLFRFYVGYVFPLIKRIDEGVELWLDPEKFRIPSSLQRESVKYFTFMPDFLPQGLLRFALPIEKRLERSRLARYSAHFALTLRKVDGPQVLREREAMLAAADAPPTRGVALPGAP